MKLKEPATKSLGLTYSLPPSLPLTVLGLPPPDCASAAGLASLRGAFLGRGQVSGKPVTFRPCRPDALRVLSAGPEWPRARWKNFCNCLNLLALPSAVRECPAVSSAVDKHSFFRTVNSWLLGEKQTQGHKGLG